MTEIKFAKDYGYAPASPFWIVWNERGRVPMRKHADRDAAEAEAARLASISPGETFHVLAAMATISTSIEVVGNRFDPSRTPMRAEAEAVPEFIEEAPTADLTCEALEPF